MKNIKTGVDKLVELIALKKRVSLEDASKILGLGTDVIQEWAEFLEKENLITIEYKFSKVWFTEKQMSQKEKIQTVKQISSEKEAFVRKIDVAMKSLESETAGFEDVRKNFMKIQSNIKGEIETVKKELSELEKYNSLKQNIDKDIEKQKKYYSSEIEKIMGGLKKDVQEHYEMIGNIKDEKEKISEIRQRLIELQKVQVNLLTDADNAAKALAKNKEDISSERKRMDEAFKAIESIQKKVEGFEKNLMKDKQKEIDEITKRLEADKKKIMSEQDELLLKAKKTTEEIKGYNDAGEKIYKSFKGFFEKKIESEKIIKNIEIEKINLEKGLETLKKKIEGLALMQSNKNLKDQMKDITDEMKKYEVRRMKLRDRIERLVDLIRR